MSRVHVSRGVVLALALWAFAPLAAACGAGGQRFTVAIQDRRVLGELNRAEATEQVRDWGVMATVAHQGLPAAKAGAALSELPPVRFPYLGRLFTFEYGPGRRVYIDDRVLLFHDATDPHPRVTIARLADRVRRETATIPRLVESYQIRADLDRGTITIVRQDDIPGDALFGDPYGYSETTVRNPEELGGWLHGIDDLTYARLAGDALTVGGRRFREARHENLTLDDVAVLYAARLAQVRAGETSLASRQGLGFSLDPRALEDSQGLKLASDLEGLALDPCSMRSLAARELAKARRKPEWNDPLAMPTSLAAAQAISDADTSLDPYTCRWMRETLSPRVLLLAAYTRQAPPRFQISSDPTYRKIKQSLLVDAPAGRLRTAAAALTAAVELVEADTLLQCARYDGYLQGTEVGMTLFYTDLLAKLWFWIDRGGSLPIAHLPQFFTGPRIDLPDHESTTSTGRLWFAPRAGSISSRMEGPDSQLFFDPIVARVFGAISDPSGLDVEAPSDARQRMADDPVNHYYRTLADYEPQYHRLNQIMKWHAVADALAGRAARAWQPLAGAARRTDEDFFEWRARKRASLRFTGDIEERTESPDGTECINTLASYTDKRGWVFSGGVKLRTDPVEVPSGPFRDRARQLASTPSPNQAVPEHSDKGVSFGDTSHLALTAGPSRINLPEPELRFAGKGADPALRLESDNQLVVSVNLHNQGGDVQLRVELGPAEKMRQAAAAHDEATRRRLLGGSDRNPIIVDGEFIYRSDSGAVAMKFFDKHRDATIETDALSMKSLSRPEVLARLGDTEGVLALKPERRPGALQADLVTLWPTQRDQVRLSIRGRVTLTSLGEQKRSATAYLLEDGSLWISRPDHVPSPEWAKIVADLKISDAGLEALARRSNGEVPAAELAASPPASAKVLRLLDDMAAAPARKAHERFTAATRGNALTTAERETVAARLEADGHGALAAKLRDPRRTDVDAVVRDGDLHGVYRLPPGAEKWGKEVDPTRLVDEIATVDGVYIDDQIRHPHAGTEVDGSQIVADPQFGKKYSARIFEGEHASVRDDLIQIDGRMHGRVPAEKLGATVRLRAFPEGPPRILYIQKRCDEEREQDCQER